ncbi:MAG: hypothetical protein M5U31_16390 [Acidimicrobiia bacterium]|nr:hypothetical protein [Acidimicrobiia bacterium]
MVDPVDVSAQTSADTGRRFCYNGRPHVFYSNTTDGDLRHAYWNRRVLGLRNTRRLGGIQRPDLRGCRGSSRAH